MEKISHEQLAQLTKQAGAALRALSEEASGLRSANAELKQKIASYQKKERAEKIAALMEEKGIEPHLSFQEKVASISGRDNLDALEEAVGLVAPQAKLASLVEGNVEVEDDAPDVHGDKATQRFAESLASLT